MTRKLDKICVRCGVILKAGHGAVCSACRDRPLSRTSRRSEKTKARKRELYGGRWPKIRDAQLRRCGFCQRCGTRDDLTVHHVERSPIPDDMDLGVVLASGLVETLCRSCNSIEG